MNGKELLLLALGHQQTPRVPWVPFTGVQVGRLCGYTAREVLTDGDKLTRALLEAHKLYRPDGMPVVFDLQIEAEILGCELLWADKAPPSVSSHPLANKEIPAELPSAASGRVPLILETLAKLKPEIGDDTALLGLVCGPFTLAGHLRGNDIFMDMFDDPDYVHRLMAYCGAVAQTMADIYIDAGFDVIALVDPLVSQISPQHFAEFFAQPFTDAFDRIRKRGVPSSFFVCGNATRNIEAMCKTGPDSIFIDENVDIAAAKKITDPYNIAIGGNIPLTSVMLYGTQQDNMKYVVDLLDTLDKQNLLIAPGCDMPYDIPPENVVAVEQAIRETDMVREMIKNYEAPADDIAVELPDYDALKRPLVEVFTLDSATCAACTYMLSAAMEIKKQYGVKIDVVEYKFTERENIARVKKMKVTNLPSIYINGKLKFSSLIPSHAELTKAIEEVL